METILEVRDLDKSFGGIHAVDHVSFQMKRGELLGLIGPNGSGKSTTVSLIAGTYTPDGGDILYKGVSVRKYTVAKRAKCGIARTFQTPREFRGISVYDSVFTVALQKRSFEGAKACALDILQMTGLEGCKDLKSEKLPIEKRKWLDLARILANEPEVIMLDEVMAGLNPSEMEKSIQMVRLINEMGISILFIEHVMKAVAALCDRVIVLKEGALLCSGTAEEALNNDEVIQAYLGKGYEHASG